MNKKVYLIGYWARYGIREYEFAGDFVEDPVFGYAPTVYYHNDQNGTNFGNVEVVPITEVTTGICIFYCFDRHLAELFVNLLEKQEETK